MTLSAKPSHFERWTKIIQTMPIRKAKKRAPTTLWAIFRDGKVLVAHASRRNARDQLDAYKLDGHSKHKWTMARVTIADGVSEDGK